MVGKQSFERVSHEVDKEDPQSSGKQDGTHNSSGLHRHTVSVQERHSTASVNVINAE